MIELMIRSVLTTSLIITLMCLSVMLIGTTINFLIALKERQDNENS